MGFFSFSNSNCAHFYSDGVEGNIFTATFRCSPKLDLYVWAIRIDLVDLKIYKRPSSTCPSCEIDLFVSHLNMSEQTSHSGLDEIWLTLKTRPLPPRAAGLKSLSDRSREN